MAGIGFHLQELFKEDHFSSRVKAYSLAGLVAAGPWIIITLSMVCIQLIINQFSIITVEERELFIFSIGYCFIFSQIIFSSQQFIATRFVSDLLYAKKYSSVFPTFIGVSKIITLIAFALWGVFALISPLPIVYKLVLLFLFLLLNYIWVLLLFLSAAKEYKTIAIGFITGGSLSILLVFFICQVDWLAQETYLLPFMLTVCFSAGMLLTLFFLLYVLVKTFPDWGGKGQFQYLAYFDRFPSMFWIGILYTIGIWICNWMIWFGEGARSVAGTFIVHPIYDTALFWSYLTILPTMILFVISVETKFYKEYKLFFNCVNNGGTFTQITESKERMVNVLIGEIKRLLRVQLIVTMVCVLAAGYVFRWFSFEEMFIGVFRITAIGALANAMLLVLILLLLYFEDRKGALYSTLLFFSMNLLLTVLFLPGGFDYYGLSFSIGSIISFIFAAIRLSVIVHSIEYHAFCGQGVDIKAKSSFFEKWGKWLNKNQII